MRRFEPGLRQITLLVTKFCLGHRRIEFDEDLTSLDALSVPHVDRANDANLQRLNDLGTIARNDPARRRGDDIDLAETCPSEGNTEQCYDSAAYSARHWWWRGLDNFERGRQEGEFFSASRRFVQTREGSLGAFGDQADQGPSGPHRPQMRNKNAFAVGHASHSGEPLRAMR